MSLTNGLRKIIFLLAILATVLIAAFSILGYFGYYSWIIDLFSHFRFQYLLVAGICFFIFILYKSFSWAVVSFILCLMNFVEVYPYLSFYSEKELSCELKISAINVLSINRESEKVIAFIKEEDPDIIILQEYTEWWETALKDFVNDHAFKYEINRADNFGIAIVSKTAPTSIEVINLSKTPVPSLLATYEIDGKEIKILATHPVSPLSKGNFKHRNEQLANVAQLKEDLGDYFIIAGDLNITPYSWFFKVMKEQLDAEEARKNFGLNATWPALPWPLIIPIDHILISPNLKVIDFNNGNYIGSDHLPVTACIQID